MPWIKILGSNYNTLEHDFNGHEVNGMQGVYGTKFYNRSFHLVNKLYDFTGIHDLSGDFCHDDFFRKTHARLYMILTSKIFFRALPVHPVPVIQNYLTT